MKFPPSLVVRRRSSSSSSSPSPSSLRRRVDASSSSPSLLSVFVTRHDQIPASLGSSKALTCLPNVGWVILSARAAADNEPSSAVTKKALALFQSKLTEVQSIHQLMQIRISKIENLAISILY